MRASVTGRSPQQEGVAAAAAVRNTRVYKPDVEAKWPAASGRRNTRGHGEAIDRSNRFSPRARADHHETERLGRAEGKPSPGPTPAHRHLAPIISQSRRLTERAKPAAVRVHRASDQSSPCVASGLGPYEARRLRVGAVGSGVWPCGRRMPKPAPDEPQSGKRAPRMRASKRRKGPHEQGL